MEKYVNKVIFGNDVLIDLTSDTITKDSLLKDVTAHDKSGASIVGECTFDSDTTDATAIASEILENKIAYSQKNKVIGTMPNNEGIHGEISDLAVPYTIPVGYHDGSGTVELDPISKAKMVPENIREGINILGVEGTMSGTEGVKAESKTVTPVKDGATVVPGESFNYLSEVIIKPIPYTLVDNASGGQTATIAGVSVPVLLTSSRVVL